MGNFKLGTLIGPDMLSQNQMMHEDGSNWGSSGGKHAKEVKRLAESIGMVSDLIDYGAGKGTLGKTFRKMKWRVALREYDPAVKHLARMPTPGQLVICTDVMEHVEEDKVDNVLRHIKSLAMRAAYLVIACRPANQLLPNGANSHITLHDSLWWIERVGAIFQPEFDMQVDVIRANKGTTDHEVRLWLTKT